MTKASYGPYWTSLDERTGSCQHSVPEGCRAPLRGGGEGCWPTGWPSGCPASPGMSGTRLFRRAFRLPARDCWPGATPGRQGRGCEYTLAAMPHQALGAGGRSRHGTCRRCARVLPAAVPQEFSAPADKQEGRCESREGRIVNRPPTSFHTALQRRRERRMAPVGLRASPVGRAIRYKLYAVHSGRVSPDPAVRCQWASKMSGYWALKMSGSERCSAEGAERPERGSGPVARSS